MRSSVALGKARSRMGECSDNCRTVLLPVTHYTLEASVPEQRHMEVNTTNDIEEIIIKEG
jgi:hypothetical protein